MKDLQRRGKMRALDVREIILILQLTDVGLFLLVESVDDQMNATLSRA